MRESNKIKVGISVGDPNGIGLEIILKSFQDKRIYDFFTPIVFAHHKNFMEEQKKLGLLTRIVVLKNQNKPSQGQLNIVDVWKQAFPVVYGQESKEAGAHAISSLKAATRALKAKEVDVLLTAPIHKNSIQSKEFNFPGHTDYLNQTLEGESLMFMISDTLRVALVSDHISLGEITSYLTSDRIEKKISLLEESLKKDFGISRPKIAVLAINPHAGDNGVIGKEDDVLLKPLLQKRSNEGGLVFGPFAADGFFGNQTYKNYDAVLAMYHDQGLIPFKTLSFGKGVNFTAGLNRVRTSPDHGTALDIAGKGIADASSFIEALFASRSIFLKRQEFERNNPN